MYSAFAEAPLATSLRGPGHEENFWTTPTGGPSVFRQSDRLVYE